MRAYTAQPETKQERVDDTERAIESRYTYEREGFVSTLAYVATFRHALASEYLDSWRASGGAQESVRADLRRFERWRFAAELEPSAHGVLLHAVLLRAFPDEPRFRCSGVAHPREITPAWEPGEFSGKAPRPGPVGGAAEAMPRARLSEREHAQRVWAMQQQAEVIE